MRTIELTIVEEEICFFRLKFTKVDESVRAIEMSAPDRYELGGITIWAYLNKPDLNHEEK